MALGTASKNIKKAVQKVVENPGKSAGKVLGTAFTKNAKHGPSLANLYTGKKLRESAVLGPAVVGGLALGGGPKSLFGEKSASASEAKDLNVFNVSSNLAPRMGIQPIMKVESPMMQADGIIQEDKTLGADGSMVFGMHNRRRG